MLSSCGSTNRPLKAKPAKLSAFFEYSDLVTDSRKKLPFHKIWMTPDHELKALAVMKTRLLIAFVNLQYSRPA